MKHPTRRRWIRYVVAAIVLVALLVLILVAPVETGSTRIVTATEIARSPSDVFAYVTTPRNWPRWHPSSIAVGGDADLVARALARDGEQQGGVVMRGIRDLATQRGILGGVVHAAILRTA